LTAHTVLTEITMFVPPEHVPDTGIHRGHWNVTHDTSFHAWSLRVEWS